jgi:hypothetical protein
MPEQRKVPPDEFDGDAIIAELASRQGVSPVVDLESVLGPGDADAEAVDDFLRLLREWRHEGAASE